MKMRTLAVCADDFGLNPGINHGILRLARRARLTEISCIVNAPAWTDGARKLLAAPPVAQGALRLGLHWNLTEGQPLSRALRQRWPHLPTLPQLLTLSHLRLLPRAALRDELHAQFEAFEAAVGGAAHLDGHQHVHHLPLLRDLVLDAAAARPGLRVRDTGSVIGPGHGFKRWVIRKTGGTRLRRSLVALERQANPELVGVYDFTATADYRRLMQSWLAALPNDGALLFCHPGEGTDGDTIGLARRRELAYLDSDAFAADLYAAGVRLGHVT
jgi:chitin disaccharide deacetylase